MTEYYYYYQMHEHGPFSLEELKLQPIKKDTPIWHKDLEKWIHAGKLQELKEIFEQQQVK